MSASDIGVPADVASITAEWLTGALSHRFPGVRVAAARQTAFIDGTAQKIRYALDYAPGADAGAPASLWVKGGFDPKGASQGEAFINEVNFFRDLAPRLPINLPDCYFGAIDRATANGVIVLEDLINRDAVFGHTTRPLSPAQVASVLSLQAKLHAAFWKSPRLADYPWLKAGGAMAAAGMVDQFFGLWEPATLLPRFAHVPPAQRDKARAQRALNQLIRDLINEANCLIHGDAGLPNIFFDGDGQPGYLDWQHTMRGCWAFDVATFVVTALTPADRRASDRDLVTHYLSELSAAGAPAPNFDEAWLRYRRYAMWPFMWVMLPNSVHPEEVCTLNAERACAAIEDLGTLEALETPRG